MNIHRDAFKNSKVNQLYSLNALGGNYFLQLFTYEPHSISSSITWFIDVKGNFKQYCTFEEAHSALKVSQLDENSSNQILGFSLFNYHDYPIGLRLILQDFLSE